MRIAARKIILRLFFMVLNADYFLKTVEESDEKDYNSIKLWLYAILTGA